MKYLNLPFGKIFLSLLFLSCHSGLRYSKTSSFGDNGMVVSAHPEATKIGLDILRKGGNATDAMVGVHFALAVCYPIAGNIGGGGFMVHKPTDGVVECLNFREKAPLAASKDMYLDQKGEVIKGKSVFGAQSPGVPGSVLGMWEAHKKNGSLPWEDLVKPAALLAKTGFPLPKMQAERLTREADVFVRENPLASVISFLKEGGWKEGDVLIQKNLAMTLERISKHGKSDFYEGETAKLLVEQMEISGGIISLEDLKSYTVSWEKPLKTEYRNHTVYSMPPPSSGGIILMQLLEMVEPFPLREMGQRNPKTRHLLSEMERRCYADRSEYLGDPDFFNLPLKEMVSKSYLDARTESFSFDRANTSSEILPGSLSLSEKTQTTHYSIVDKWGNAISVTTTQNDAYGSRLLVSKAGFLLNDQMDDFSAKPGVPNIYGLVGNVANSITPGKRMLSSMTPTIVLKNDSLVMVLGSPGGSTIITSVFQTILNVVDHKMDLKAAVDAGKTHHQWLPDKLFYEKGALSISDKAVLKNLGHHLQKRTPIGRLDAILVKKKGLLEGYSDPRGYGQASGY